jgi:hypothetical protein
METTALKGTSEEQKMAGWVANLLMQRGFIYALNADVELAHADLVEYFASQAGAQEPAEIASLLDRATEANAHLFRQREATDGSVIWISKRQLVELFQSPTPPEPAPAVARTDSPRPKPTPKAEAPAKKAEPAPTRKRKAPEKPVASEKVSLDDLPVTQQYQLAVLKAMHSMDGSGKAALIVDMVPTLMNLPEEHQGTYARGPEGKSEEAKYIKFVHSARRFLIKQGELESPTRGIWAITAAGSERLKAAGLIE